MSVEHVVPILMVVGFMGLLIVINRRNLGVSSFEDYATASRSIGTLGITFGVLATWYVGATFTAWAGFAVDFGFIAFYVTPYALMTLVIMYLVAERTFIWGKRHRIETQAELMGMRYRSRWIRVLVAFAGVAWSVPWLLMEWWTQGFVLNYVTDGAISPFWGMLLGVVVVVSYVALGGMRSVITANILQGLYMFVIGTGVIIWLIYQEFGGFGPLLDHLAAEYPAMLTFAGEGWDPPSAYWTSIVVASGLGGFMWPWVYNKLFAADSVRTIKKTVLIAPILGTIFYAAFVFLGMGLHTSPDYRGNSQEAFLAFAENNGPLVLGLLGVLVTAASVSTVSGILNSMSTAISNDLATALKRNIPHRTALRIARWSVVVLGIGALLGAAIQQGKLIFLALLTYQGIIMLCPVVLLGLYWKRANKEGAIAGLVAGTALSFILNITQPSFIGEYGWEPGIHGLILAVVIMVGAGFLKPKQDHVDSLWAEFEQARRRARSKTQAAKVAGNISGARPGE